MPLPRLLPATLALALLASTAAAEGNLTLFANGETLATSGFTAPALTRDGWALRFDHIYVTLADITALQTDPPYQAGAGDTPAVQASAVFDTTPPLTIDLVAARDDGRVQIGSVTAPAGHYNAIRWSIVPATSGDWAGQSMVLTGTATRGDTSVDFTLTSAETHDYICGEYVGETRKGFVTADSPADLELTFHLDHLFGRADRDAAGHMNTHALGFDAFAAGGTQAITLNGLHIGHVGEGHCAVSYR